ncbi:MAG: GNAT family N-acetyltransferase [Acidobacteriota bacterium]|nr:GNAT family N-acetyltransferase [Acidobacteriota bacterium]
MQDIPEIQTARLLLRAHRLSDFPHCAAMWADPNVTRYIGGRPLTNEEAWAKLVRYAGFWTLLGFGFWAIEERATGRWVGELGLADFRREMNPPLGNAPEAGWVLASPAHGKGFATEALTAALDWADGNIAADRTVCIVNPENAASIRVALKCGFAEQRRSSYGGSEVVVFSRPNRTARIVR